MPSPDVIIASPNDALKAGWRTLYNGYATFYNREMTDDIAAAVWSWINDPAHELNGAVALVDGTPAGLIHFRRMPSPLRGADIGFLDDMFIDPAMRGRGIADVLFEHLHAEAKARGWDIVRWITADDNYRARSLYDRLSKKTSWNLYEMPV